MDAAYLARNDGSLESAGRGSGFAEELNQSSPKPIPYMQMTFAPLERRLDTAIFRALFASSARQARQFVIHGAVKVNGKKVLTDKPIPTFAHIYAYTFPDATSQLSS
jgi:ribosomal protein S4